MENLNLYIPLNYPLGTYLVKPIKELKDDNLIFHISADEGFLDEDTILRNIKIFNEEHEKIVSKAKVSFCEKQVDEEFRHSWYKIGLNFIEYEKNFNKRPTRFNKELINNLQTKIFFKLNDNEYRAELLNFSKFGASLLLKNPKFVLAKSDVLRDMRLEVDGKIFYEGDGVVVNIKNIEFDVEIGLSFKNGHIPVDEIANISTNQKVDFVYNEIVENLGIYENISPEFKSKVNEFRYYLDVLKLQLDTFEEQLKKYPAKERYELGHNLLEKLREEKFKDIDKILLETDNLVESLKLNYTEFEVYKKYYQNVLHPLLLSSPLISRIYRKPLGYAGDYEMMNMIYRNAYDGDTLFGKFCNKYTSYTALSQANRNRLPYLLEKIKNVIKNNKKENTRIKITSVACGPAIEVQEFMKDDLADFCDFTLLDVSSEALSYTRDKLEKLKKKYKRKTNFIFLQESVFDLIKKQKSRALIKDGQDIIYSLGLFEYLTDYTCQRLITVLYDKLSSNSLLIVGNYSDHNNLKTYIELGGEWFLFYRKQYDLKQLAKDVNDYKSLHIENDGVLQFNTFLNIIKG